VGFDLSKPGDVKKVVRVLLGLRRYMESGKMKNWQLQLHMRREKTEEGAEGPVMSN
jgi:hypothetical protein